MTKNQNKCSVELRGSAQLGVNSLWLRHYKRPISHYCHLTCSQTEILISAALIVMMNVDVGLCMAQIHANTKYTHTHTHTHTHKQGKLRNKAFFMEAGWGSPTKTPAALSPLAVTSTTPWAHKE